MVVPEVETLAGHGTVELPPGRDPVEVTTGRVGDVDEGAATLTWAGTRMPSVLGWGPWWGGGNRGVREVSHICIVLWVDRPAPSGVRCTLSYLS